MSRDYGNPEYRASTPEHKAAMRQVMAIAHNAYTMASMTSNNDSIEVVIDFDMAVFGDGDFWDYDAPRTQMESVIFNSMFSRFRAEGRYGEMTVSFGGGHGGSRDTY